MPKQDTSSDDAPKHVKAVRCNLNPGVFDSTDKQTFQSSRIWVDDALTVAVGILAMKMALTAIIKAMFVVSG